MDILVRPEELRRAAGQIHRSAKVIAANLQQVDEWLKALTPAHFEGQSADQLRRRYQARRDALLNAQAKANVFADGLETIASQFEKADRKMQAGPAAGSVLGISTLSPAVESESAIRASYLNMRWAERFSAFSALEGDYQRLLGLVDPEKMASAKDQLSEYDRLIAAEEARLAEARQGGDSFRNKVIPTFPLQGDGDGVPWRVKADDFEDAEAAAMQNLQELHAKRNALQNEYDVMLTNQNQLESVSQRRAVLNNLITEGIPPDGPTNNWLRSLLGGCTNYVAEKRDVSAFPNANGEPGHPGHATNWNDQAAKAGYEVGNIPVKGSIMVLEKGTHGANETMGHVAYVENVTFNDGVYRVFYSEASLAKDINGNGILGNHLPVTSNHIDIPATGSDANMSFIYDKRP